MSLDLRLLQRIGVIFKFEDLSLTIKGCVYFVSHVMLCNIILPLNAPSQGSGIDLNI